MAAAWAERPVNYVSWGDAARFANWLHKGQPTGAQTLSTTEDGAYLLNGAITDLTLLAVSRKAAWQWAIASEDEWYKAAYHKNDGLTGNYWDYPTASDTVPGRDLADASGNNANYYGAPLPIDSPYYLTGVGQFGNSVGPYGTFDQGGNIYEWTEEIVSSDGRGLRGGHFAQSVWDLSASVRRRTFPSLEDSGIGFRVVEVPEPATLATLALGGLAMIRRRRRV